VKLLVLLHVIAITSWALPNAGPAVMNHKAAPRGSEWLLYLNDAYVKKSPVQLYVLSTGVWQSWDMFSPNPADTDIYADAEVTYKDGSTALYPYPRMYVLPVVTKYIKERYRKFFEHANTDEYLWPFFAKRVAYLRTQDPNNPPVTVKLHRHWYVVPKLESFPDYLSDFWTALSKGKMNVQTVFPTPPELPKTYNDYVYYQFPPEPAQDSGSE